MNFLCRVIRAEEDDGGGIGELLGFESCCFMGISALHQIGGMDDWLYPLAISPIAFKNCLVPTPSNEICHLFNCICSQQCLCK